MGFRRAIGPSSAPAPHALTADMIGIGMMFAGEGNPDANVRPMALYQEPYKPSIEK